MIIEVLAQVASHFRDLSSVANTSNGGETGYWREIALSAEAIAGVSNVANSGEQGYMLRTALALESIAGTSGAEENENYPGLLKRIVDALEVQSGVGVGSLEYRFLLAAEEFNGGGGGGSDIPDGFAAVTTNGIPITSGGEPVYTTE